jgi:LacI family transcriptional regulator
MTVSRVINGEAYVQPDTAEKVQVAITELGYVPNPAARSLAGGRRCRLALLYTNPSAAYLSEFLMGCLAQASASDALLLVNACPPNIAPAELAAQMTAQHVDAVILPSPLCDNPAILEALASAGLTLVQVATGHPVAEIHAVTIDDAAAAHEMTLHLAALGHRRIGLIEGAANQTASALRRQGYDRALAESGLPRDPTLVAAGDFSYRSGLAAAELLLALPEPPTAIFACNDDMAAAAVAVAHRHHLEVPAALTVVGFDDTAMATTIWPELTTIRQPVADMARLATEILIEATRAGWQGRPVAPRHVQLDYTLIKRGSDGELP